MTVSETTYDFAVIGAGIAGASIAGELAVGASVVLLEMESQPGYHATGRSAAVFAPAYGPAPIRALTRASAGFYHDPPAGFASAPLLKPLDVIMLAGREQESELTGFMEELRGEGAVSRISAEEIRKRHPLVREGYAIGGALDTGGSAIDVDVLHRGFINLFRKSGGTLVTNSIVHELKREDGMWSINAGQQKFRASKLINAAGAWADTVGSMAGAERIGLVPKRRTALIVDAPDGLDVASLPLIVDIEEQFYMKPDAGNLLLSPANEDPMEPCDAQPEEMDIAICVDRIERAFNIKIGRIKSKWAGLRSFVADGAPVVGYSGAVEGFFWLAGQGGYGVQSAPALARYAAARALGNAIPGDIRAAGLDPAHLEPDRLKPAA